MTPLAAAIAHAVAAAPRRRVPLTTLFAAAAAVDRTGAVSSGWRARIAAALEELANAGMVELPRSRWDTTAQPPLPAYVTRPTSRQAVKPGAEVIVWHVELGWAAKLEAAGKLSKPERRFLAQVNMWLHRRGDTVVPQRERSLDICGDEKALDAWVFTPLFAPGRLTYGTLRCEPCWPPVHQELLGPGPWLFIENWTTYRTLSRAARRCRWDGRLIWGAGNQVGTRLTTLAATEGIRGGGLWYFGDVDAAGFRIARMAAGRAEALGLGKLHAARELYRLCCDVGTACTTTNRAPDDLRHWTQTWLGGGLGQDASEIVAGGGRIVQETIGVELLNTINPAGLLPR
jgi:hypothetical protein